MYRNQPSQGTISGGGTTKPVYIMQSNTRAETGARIWSRDLDIDPIIRKSRDIVTRLVNIKSQYMKKPPAVLCKLDKKYMGI